MNENQRPWTSDEKITGFRTAVEQCRATGGRLDWRAIAATLFLGAAHKPRKRSATRSCTRSQNTLMRIRAPAARGLPARQRLVASVFAGAAVCLIPWIASGIGSAVRATNGRSPPDPHTTQLGFCQFSRP